jgi:Na+/proline symporter
MNSVTQIMLGMSLMVVVSLMLGSRKRDSHLSLRRYFWGEQDFKASDIAHLILSTSFSFNGIMYQTWLGYSIGWAALWLQVAWCASYLWMRRYASIIKAEAVKGGTLHGAVGCAFGPGAEKLAAVASIIGFTLQVGWELGVAVIVFTFLLPGSAGLLEVSAAALALIAAVYTIRGGLRGNLRANIFQNLFAIATLIVAIVVLCSGATGYHSPPLIESHKLLVTGLGIGGLVTNVIFSVFWQFVDMSNWQNLAAADTKPDTPNRALLTGATLVFLFPGLVGTVAGVALAGVPNLTSNDVVAQMLTIVQQFSPVLFVCVVMGFVAAMLSTLDGLLLAAAQAVTWDLTKHDTVRRILARGEVDEDARPEREVLTQSRVAVFVLALAGSSVIYLYKFKIIDLFNLVYVVTAAQMTLVPVVFCILRGRHALNGFASILGGLVVGLTLVGYGLVAVNATVLTWAPAIGLATAALLLLVPRSNK